MPITTQLTCSRRPGIRTTGPHLSTIYEGYCSNCNYRSSAIGGYMSLRLDNGTHTAIMHPGEHMQLEAEGFTWNEERRQNRIAFVDLMHCNQCGHIEEQFRSGPARNCSVCLSMFCIFVIWMAFFPVPLWI